MEQPVVVDVQNVTRKFNLSTEKVDNLKEYFIRIAKRNLMYNEFIAVNDVSFQVHKGEVFGLVGLNGSGKSTMLKLISGIYKPTSGVARTQGRVVPLLELGCGFDAELTGRENILLNGAILGYSEEFLRSHLQEIIDYSELGQFIEMPLKTYSSGMLARLAFSVATVVKPDVLIVDEILAVGDERFQRKSHARMMELMSGGTTVLFVSHSLPQIRQMCDHVVWLDHGKVRAFGPTDEVCDQYAADMA